MINLETGELSAMASMLLRDKNGKNIFFDNHPDSGAVIKGKIIPGWPELKQKIIELTAKLPFFYFTAWDKN